MAEGKVSADTAWPAEALTKTEQKVFDAVMDGKTTSRLLAQQFIVSEKTIRSHLTRIYRKLGVKNMSALILKQKAAVVGSGVELRACNRMLGVLTPTLELEVKRGDLLIIVDLIETLRQQRPVYTVRTPSAYNKNTSNVANDL